MDAAGNPTNWMAHEACADVIPETWVDEIACPSGDTERVIFGVDGIVKDRWNLVRVLFSSVFISDESTMQKCSACLKSRPKAHGAPIQCTKGKCSKAFHVSCARDGTEHHIVYREVGQVQKEVVLVDYSQPPAPQATDSSFSASPMEEVIKVITKVEVEVLCAQHNPVCLLPRCIHSSNAHFSAGFGGCQEGTERRSHSGASPCITSELLNQNPRQLWCFRGTSVSGFRRRKVC